MRSIVCGIAILTLLLGSGCASIVSKSNYPVTLDTNPTGLEIEVADSKGKVLVRGTSPVHLNLESSRGYFSSGNYTLRTVGAGSGNHAMLVRASLDPWFFGNLLFGGLIGMLIVDPITGAMYELEKEYVLDCGGAAAID